MKTPVFFLDIDDCLIKTSKLTKAHLTVVGSQLLVFGIKKSKEITKEFAADFYLLFKNHQGEKLSPTEEKSINIFLERMKELQKPAVVKYGEVKRWSRETGLYVAAEKFGVKLTNSQIQTVISALWEKITQNAIFYPDAKRFLAYLENKKIPFYLITSTDSRLTLNDNTGLFEYDPQYSRGLKYKRLKIFTDMGIPKNRIFIADPIDKPNIDVFKRAFSFAKEENGKPFSSIMVSDSVKNDLHPAQKVGMEKLVWINRGGKKTHHLSMSTKIMTIKDFREIIK